jgi:hypothetical protein
VCLIIINPEYIHGDMHFCFIIFNPARREKRVQE